MKYFTVKLVDEERTVIKNDISESELKNDYGMITEEQLEKIKTKNGEFVYIGEYWLDSLFVAYASEQED